MQRKSKKYEKRQYGRLLLLLGFLLCINDLSAKTQWYKYFHSGELDKFRKETFEVLRQPLENRKIVISRAKYSLERPASFMLVFSTNPCSCGYYGDPTHHYVCTSGQIVKYMTKISGPLLYRIDIQCEIQPLTFEKISKKNTPLSESSATIRERVIKVRNVQIIRHKDYKGVYCNAQISERMIHQFAEPDEQGLALLRMAMSKLSLSARTYTRILKVARTFADLAGSEKIQSQHIVEAVGYRNIDRGDWAERGYDKNLKLRYLRV